MYLLGRPGFRESTRILRMAAPRFGLRVPPCAPANRGRPLRRRRGGGGLRHRLDSGLAVHLARRLGDDGGCRRVDERDRARHLRDEPRDASSGGHGGRGCDGRRARARPGRARRGNRRQRGQDPRPEADSTRAHAQRDEGAPPTASRKAGGVQRPADEAEASSVHPRPGLPGRRRAEDARAGRRARGRRHRPARALACADRQNARADRSRRPCGRAFPRRTRDLLRGARATLPRTSWTRFAR
jgi:hypothetical protein